MCLSLETLTSIIDWLTYSSGTDRPGEFSNYLSLDPRLSYSHSPAVLYFFLSSDTSICSAMAFPLLGNSDDAVV